MMSELTVIERMQQNNNLEQKSLAIYGGGGATRPLLCDGGTETQKSGHV